MERCSSDILRCDSLSPSIPLCSSTPLHDEDIDISFTSSTTSESADDTSDSFDSCSLPSLDISLISCGETSFHDATMSRDDSPDFEPSVSVNELEDAHKSINAGYKLVFDNIDKNIKPRFMRSDSQTVSLHYVQAYGVKDRINFSSYGCERPTQSNLYTVLPDTADYELLKRNFQGLISRMIVAHIPFFKEYFKKSLVLHIPHKYSAEMCKKSEVVCSIIYKDFNS